MRKYINYMIDTGTNIAVLRVLLVLMVFGVSLCAQMTDHQVILSNFKLPEYNDEGKLQVVCYGGKADAKGIIVGLEDVLVDFVQDNIKNIDEVKNFEGLKLYSIDMTPKKVEEFWKDKPHSRALLGAPEAKIDRVQKTIRGDGKVHLRSRLMDIDGVGFDVDFPSKTVHIRSKVTVVIRTGMQDMMMAAKNLDNKKKLGINKSEKDKSDKKKSEIEQVEKEKPEIKTTEKKK